MKLSFDIAIRFLKSNKGQTFLILAGIVVGVAVQIFIGTLIGGLQKSLIDKTIGSSSQITIESANKDKYFNDDNSLYENLNQDNRITAVSKALDSSAFLYEDDQSYPIILRGFNLEDAEKIYKLKSNLVYGELPSNDYEVIIGKNLAQESGVEIGDIINVLTPQGKKVDVKVVGIYDLGVASVNKSWVVTTLESERKILEQDNQLSSIEIQVKDVFSADKIANDIAENQLSSGLKTSNWKEQNEQLLSGLSGQSASSYMIQVFVLVSVVLGISSVLAVSVIQRSKQIGILKAMGIKDRAASQIFLFQGLTLGVIGSVAGAIFGLSLTYSFSVFVKNSDGTPLVPFYIDYKFILISMVIAIVAATFAALIPARNSSKLNPIEVIKNG